MVDSIVYFLCSSSNSSMIRIEVVVDSDGTNIKIKNFKFSERSTGVE